MLVDWFYITDAGASNRFHKNDDTKQLELFYALNLRRTTMKPFELAPLPYAYDYLEPVIDAETMKLHHDKHHQAYVNNLNAAIAKYPDLPYGCVT